MKDIIDFFETKGAQVKYLYADYNHSSKKYDKRVYPNGVALHVPPYGKNMSIKRLYSHFIFSKRVKKYLHTYDPDIIYGIFPPNLLVKEIADFKKNHKAKIIFDMYDTWPESIPLKRFKFICKIPFKVWANMRNVNLCKADLITTVSKESSRCVQKMVDDLNIPIRVIYPVIRYTGRPEYKLGKHDCLSLCYLGNVNYITDVDLMTNLLRELNKYVNVRVHFIGGGFNYSQIVESFRFMGIEVVSHGVVFDLDEKNEIFSMCDMGINLPKKEIHSSMSLKSIEYLRAGLPFINSGIGDNWQMVKQRNIGINVSRNLISESAEKIIALTPEKLQKMNENCINTYEQLFIEQNLEEIFEPILSGTKL